MKSKTTWENAVAGDTIGKPKAVNQHTPGPWRVNGDAIFDSCGNRISTAFQPFYRRGNEPQQNLSDLQAANARLIASAPALLEALKKCKAAVENGSLPPSARMEMVRDYATPTIAAAEGRVA